MKWDLSFGGVFGVDLMWFDLVFCCCCFLVCIGLRCSKAKKLNHTGTSYTSMFKQFPYLMPMDCWQFLWIYSSCCSFTKVICQVVQLKFHDGFLRPPHMGALLTKVKATGCTAKCHGVHLSGLRLGLAPLPATVITRILNHFLGLGIPT